jgi:hypothetical protein
MGVYKPLHTLFCLFLPQFFVLTGKATMLSKNCSRQIELSEVLTENFGRWLVTVFTLATLTSRSYRERLNAFGNCKGSTRSERCHTYAYCCRADRPLPKHEQKNVWPIVPQTSTNYFLLAIQWHWLAGRSDDSRASSVSQLSRVSTTLWSILVVGKREPCSCSALYLNSKSSGLANAGTGVVTVYHFIDRQFSVKLAQACPKLLWSSFDLVGHVSWTLLLFLKKRNARSAMLDERSGTRNVHRTIVSALQGSTILLLYKKKWL